MKSVGVVGAEDGQALRLKGDLEYVRRHDDGVVVERIRAEAILKQCHHPAERPEVGRHPRPKSARIGKNPRHPVEALRSECVAADLHSREIGRGRLRLLPARREPSRTGYYAAHARLAKHEFGPLLGIVGVDRDVGAAGRKDGENRM